LSRSDLWDQWLLAPEGESTPLPERLWPVSQRLFLLEQEISPTQH
jgi:hypothetical protein